MTRVQIYIYGKHALKEALLHKPKSVEKVFLSGNTAEDKELVALLKKAGIAPKPLSGTTLKKGSAEEASHQGVVALIALSEIVVSYDEFIKACKIEAHTGLVLLDELSDPHNVGAIIRSAVAFGISGVLFPAHNQAPITGAVVKVSAGMAFRAPLVSIGNVNTTARDLKERGFWIYGLQGDAPQNIATEKFDAPAVFIFGNGATGIRLKTRELCDSLLSIPMNPGCESLNVSASAAVALYAWSAQHPRALKKDI